jgi:hypothetical protein
VEKSISKNTEFLTEFSLIPSPSPILTMMTPMKITNPLRKTVPFPILALAMRIGVREGGRKVKSGGKCFETDWR